MSTGSRAGAGLSRKATQFKSCNSDATRPGRRGQGRGSAPRHRQPAPTARRGREEPALAQTSGTGGREGGRERRLRPRGSIGAPLADSGLRFHITERLGMAGCRGEGAQPAARPSLLGPDVVEGQQDHAVRQEGSFGSWKEDERGARVALP